MKSILKTYKECRTHQDWYVVGENALQSLKLARDVALAREIGLEVKFEHEQDCWINYIGDIDSPETWTKRFENGSYEVLFAYVEDDCGEILASLGGIVVSCDEDGRAYLHAIELELLSEAISTLKNKSGGKP